MSWFDKLFQTYEQATKLAQNSDSSPNPINHTTQNAHINITISANGTFLAARVLVELPKIVLPATEGSDGRTGKVDAPHALADKLQYVAGDYETFGGAKPAHFESYKQQLSQWCNSDYQHPSAQAVLAYISKKSVIENLIQQRIVHVDKDSTLLTTWGSESEAPLLFQILPKNNGKLDQGNALICWTVENPAIEDKDTWRDKKLQNKWILYMNSMSTTQGLCYATGLWQPVVVRSHPAKLRHSADWAKIISSDDETGFTFRGRFIDRNQAVVIGAAATQKAHSALRWLLKRRYVFKNGDTRVVAWAISGTEIPELLVGTEKMGLYDFDDYSESEPPDIAEQVEQKLDQSRDLGKNYAKKLSKYMASYHTQIDPNDTISIMAVDSATPGRMGITYYRELMPTDYLDKISKWHNNFAWFQRFTKETRQKNGRSKKQVFWGIGAPSPAAIMKGIYGDLLKGNEKLSRTFYERIIPCILEDSNIPYDLVTSAVNRASSRSSKEDYDWEDWENCLGVACSLYRGFRIRHPQTSQRREFPMSLEKSNNSRDYLYGRLLAIAERIEEVELNAEDVNRPTTANRSMQRFYDRPYSTWLIIYHQLIPYMCKLGVARKGFLVNMMREMDEVMSLFSPDEFKLDSRLSGEYLLGFHAQRLELRPRKTSTTPDEHKDTQEQ